MAIDFHSIFIFFHTMEVNGDINCLVIHIHIHILQNKIFSFEFNIYIYIYI